MQSNSNNIQKAYATVIHKTLPILLILILMYACKSNNPVKTDDNKKKYENFKIGRYVFLDSHERLHIDKQHIDDHGAGVEFVNTADLQVWHLNHVCPECVSETNYQALLKIASSHKAE